MSKKESPIIYRTFSGADISVYLIVPYSGDGQTGFKKFANLSTISYSIYRDKQAVTPIGFSRPKGVTRGPRTIAGTMVFAVFDTSAFQEIVGTHFTGENKYDKVGPVLLDELPPLDIYIFMSNEYGRAAHFILFGVELLNEGQVQSIDDLYTENTVNYIAHDIFPLKPVDKPLSSFDAKELGSLPQDIADGDIQKMKELNRRMRQEY